MAAEHFIVTRERISEIIGKNMCAQHLNPVFEAIRDFGVSVLIAPQCRDSLDEALDEARDASIVIIGDDTDRALGPDGFHKPSMRRLFRLATETTVISSAPPERVYAGMSTLAALGRRFVVIVTPSAPMARPLPGSSPNSGSSSPSRRASPSRSTPIPTRTGRFSSR